MTDQKETNAAMEFMNREDIFDPDPLELRARITVLEGAVAALVTKLSPSEEKDFKSMLHIWARAADDMNSQLVGQARTRHEEFTHQLNVAARELLSKINDITPPQSDQN